MIEPSPSVSIPSGKPSYPYTDLLIVASLCSVLYLVGNGQFSLWDRDEPRYAQATREMLANRDFVVPTFNAEPRYHKPVLIYWLMAASYTIFGDNEFGARFVSAVAGTITCLITYRLGTRMAGRAVGLVAALMLAVSPLMIIESKLATTDAVLTATLLAAMACVWDLHVAGFSRTRSLTFWALVGVSLLTKGPIGLAIIVTALVAWMLLSRQWRVVRRMNWLAGIAVLLAIILPWGIAVYRATDGEFYRAAIRGHLLGHALEPMENHRGFPGYYLVITLLGLFPWSMSLSLGLRGVAAWARRDGPGSFLLGWIIGPMLLLELLRTKLPHYYLPAYPAWALLTAQGLVQFHAAGGRLADSWRGRLRLAVLSTTGILAALALCGCAIAYWPGELLLPTLVWSLVPVIGTAIAVSLFTQRRDRLGWCSLVVTWGLVGIVGYGWFLPCVETTRVERKAAEEMQLYASEDNPAVLHSFRKPSVIFYLREPVPIVTGTGRLIRFVHEHGPVVTVLEQPEVKKLEDRALRVEICKVFTSGRANPLRPKDLVVARLSRASEPSKTAERHHAEKLE